MGIKVPQVEGCCCCLSLKTGTKLLGITSLVGSFIVLTRIFFGAFKYIFPHLDLEKDLQLIDHVTTLTLILHLIRFTTSVFLLIGVYKRKTQLMPCWLVSTIVMAVFESWFLQSLVWLVVGHHILKASQYSITWVIITALTLVYDVYAWLVVYSYIRTYPPAISSSELMCYQSEEGSLISSETKEIW